MCSVCQKGVLTRDRSESANQTFMNKFYSDDIITEDSVAVQYKCPLCGNKEYIYGKHPTQEEKEHVRYQKW